MKHIWNSNICLLIIPIIALLYNPAISARQSETGALLRNLKTLVDKSGKTIKKSKYKSTKYFLIYISGEWCPYCTKFTPTLTQYYNSNKNDAFEVILISRDNSREDMLKHMVNSNMLFPAMRFNKSKAKSLQKRYSMKGIPALILVDKDGYIICKSNMKDWNKNKVLSELTKIVNGTASGIPRELPKATGIYSNPIRRASTRLHDSDGNWISNPEIDKYKYIVLYRSSIKYGGRDFDKTLSDFYKIHQDNNNFEVIFLSSDGSADNSLSHMKMSNMQWPGLYYYSIFETELVSKYLGNMIPSMTVLDNNGKVILRSMTETGEYRHPADTLKEFKELLKNINKNDDDAIDGDAPNDEQAAKKNIITNKSDRDDGTKTYVLDDGSIITGMLKMKTNTEYLIKTTDGKMKNIKISEIIEVK